VTTSSWGKRATSRGWPAGAPRAAVVTLAALVSPVAFAAPAALAGLLGCGGARSAARPDPPGVSEAPTRLPVDFDFDAVDDTPVTAEAMRGLPTVISFITTSSLSSQAQADFLVAMAKHDGDHVHYALVVLEPQENRTLVELYKKALSIPFPVALADSQTVAGASAFGDVSAVPVTVLLDRAGRVVLRIEGRVVKSDEMRAAMRGL
jgi:hypothetical protein